MVNVEDVQLTFAMCSPKLHQNWDQCFNNSPGNQRTLLNYTIFTETVLKLPVFTCPISMKRSSEADASNLPSYENDTDRIGQSSRADVCRHASSLTSHNDTNASALPTAKYWYRKNILKCLNYKKVTWL